MYDVWFLSQSNNLEKWKSFKLRFPHARFKPVLDSIESSVIECASQSFTKLFYTVTDSIDIIDGWDFSWVPAQYDENYIHFWPNGLNDQRLINPIMLWPKNYVKTVSSTDDLYKGDTKLHDIPIATSKGFDIFFISFEEETADDNWEKFKDRFPTSQRIDKVQGIDNAHKLCAELSTTDMFFTVDADTILHDDWNFNYVPLLHDRQYLHLWYSLNPINNLEYGYGAVKLWPRYKVLNFNQPFIDFTTGVGGLKIHTHVIATTSFNTSEYSTWKSAFREVIKLLRNVKFNPDDLESLDRLNTWRTIFNTTAFSDWARHGVLDAQNWFEKNNDNISKINDFNWLKTYFMSKYKNG